MIVNGEYQISAVNKLAFNRISGSADERRAAQIICEEVASFGGTATLEPFNIPHYEVKKAELKVTAPFERVINAHVLGFSGSTPEEGYDAELFYAEDASDMKLKNAAGKILLLNRNIFGRWKEIVNSGALGFALEEALPTSTRTILQNLIIKFS